MPTCPSCQQDFVLKDEDFGMLPCPLCSAMIIVEMDGQAQMFQQESDEHEEIETSQQWSRDDNSSNECEPSGEFEVGEPLEETFTDTPVITSSDQGSYTSQQTDQELNYDFEQNLDYDNSPEVEPDDGDDDSGEHGLEMFADDISEELTEGHIEDNSEDHSEDHAKDSAEEYAEGIGAEFSDEGLDDSNDESVEEDYDFETPIDHQPQNEKSLELIDGGDALEEIESFGNEELSFDGPLAYDVTITGIDTSEMRIWIREALDDNRFLWNIDEVMSAIDVGELHLVGLNPVKASLVVNRVKSLSVEIQWQQTSVQSVDEE